MYQHEHLFYNYSKWVEPSMNIHKGKGKHVNYKGL